MSVKTPVAHCIFLNTLSEILSAVLQILAWLKALFISHLAALREHSCNFARRLETGIKYIQFIREKDTPSVNMDHCGPALKSQFSATTIMTSR